MPFSAFDRQRFVVVITYLILHFQINQGKTCYFRGKLEIFISKLIYNLSIFDASKIFYRGSKNAYFLIFQTLRRTRKGQNLLWLLTWPENHLESNQIEFASEWFLQRQPLKSRWCFSRYRLSDCEEALG